MMTTSNRLTHGGNTRFRVASAAPPSTLEKSVQLAFFNMY